MAEDARLSKKAISELWKRIDRCEGKELERRIAGIGASLQRIDEIKELLSVEGRDLLRRAGVAIDPARLAAERKAILCKAIQETQLIAGKAVEKNRPDVLKALAKAVKTRRPTKVTRKNHRAFIGICIDTLLFRLRRGPTREEVEAELEAKGVRVSQSELSKSLDYYGFPHAKTGPKKRPKR